MKFLSAITMILILMITGCSENQQINSPNTDFEIQKTTNPDDPNYLETQSEVLLDMIPQWLNLPEPSSSTQSPTFFTSMWVFNNKSNNLIIDTSYIGGIHGVVEIKLKLMFNAGVLPSDSMFVTAEVDIQNGTIKFGPSTVFNEPLRLDYKIQGLDFTSMDPSEIRFIYDCENGSVEPVNCWYYDVNESKGSIQMWWGEIPHFSRYGFVRRSVDF